MLHERHRLQPDSSPQASHHETYMRFTYERRSLAISSNLHPSDFDSIMPKTLATAAVDRLLHHAHVVFMVGSQP